PCRATGRKLERHKVELQEVILVYFQSISEKMYTFDTAQGSRKNLPEVKFFTSGKNCLYAISKQCSSN
uniref:hypothetical protein n=1 Tax=Malonomonas rubra TaxID=57040 RepID=UPI0026EEE7E3